MVQVLTRRRESVWQCAECLTNELTAGDPTRVSVEIADDEGCGRSAFRRRELLGLAHSDHLREFVEVIAE
jgi:hypothetical protein